jgi:hypothetical protein
MQGTVAAWDSSFGEIIPKQAEASFPLSKLSLPVKFPFYITHSLLGCRVPQQHSRKPGGNGLFSTKTDGCEVSVAPLCNAVSIRS